MLCLEERTFLRWNLLFLTGFGELSNDADSFPSGLRRPLGAEKTLWVGAEVSILILTLDAMRS